MNRSYQKCRELFLNSSSKLPLTIQRSSYELPYSDPSGKPVSTDFIKIYKNSPPKKWLLLTSGVHGLELFFGSAVQSHLLQGISDEKYILPTDVGIIMAHALNPWGSAWLRRVNINNVDLGRNFISNFPEILEKYKTDPRHIEAQKIYRDIDEIINPQSFPLLGAADLLRIGYYFWKYGKSKFNFAMLSGQRFKQRGAQFAGKSMDLEHRSFKAEIDKLLPKDSELVYHIDLHTGLGEKGKETFVVADEESNKAAIEIFGKKRVSFNTILGGEVDGALISGLKLAQKTEAKWLALTFEIGTTPIYKSYLAVRNEAIWHNQQLWIEDFSRKEIQGINTDYYLSHRTKKEILENFCPSSKEWQDSALSVGLSGVSTIIKYLASYR
ncbi:unnamed protein product [Blepharisma stoltei]|uniref:DUF2817 domain-containing protein n=1 Tax=Blepharisma stoltei TaxID=1481888 RepID=A0AAU9J3L2_9CILI|nr:unnamed protein product [Blepharisma stoltei]